MKKCFGVLALLMAFGLGLEAATQNLSKEDSKLLFGNEKVDVQVLSYEEMANTQGEFFQTFLVYTGISAGVWAICRLVSSNCTFETRTPNIKF